MYIFYVHIIIPLQKKHSIEKEDIKKRNTHLIELFSDLDPEPVFRFNKDGKIILANKAGRNLFPGTNIDGLSSKDIFKCLNKFNFNDCISRGQIHYFSTKIYSRYYNIIIKGIPDVGFGQIFCNDITQRKLIERELINSRKRLRELAHHMQKLQEEEKQKISMELHDNFGQLLTSINLNLELLKHDIQPVNIDSNRFEELTGLVQKAMKEIKDISYRLKPRILDDFGLVPSLKLLCNEMSQKSGIKGSFQAHKIDRRLNSDMETGIYRIAQEALNNIVKHSGAKEFSLQLLKYPGFIRLMVEDDGVGFDPEAIKSDKKKKNSMGLVNMYERALSFNGKIITDSRIGGGTEIIIEIPLEEQNEYN